MAILVAKGQIKTEGWGSIILLPLEYVPAFALTPRFIMSVYALRLKETQEIKGHEQGIRVGLRAHHGDCSYASVSDVRKPAHEVVPHDENIPLEEWRVTAER